MQASVVSLGDRYQNIYMTIALFKMCLTGDGLECAMCSLVHPGRLPSYAGYRYNNT